MKLQSLLFILLFSFAPSMSKGQYIPMVEEGKYWIYLDCFDGQPPMATRGHAITFQGDTMINSLSYKKVFWYSLSGYHNCPYPPCFQFYLPYQPMSKALIAFIREDTMQKTIYNLPVWDFEYCSPAEYLMFDFSLDIGDTLNDCLYEFIGGDLWNPDFGLVDSIQTVQKFGKSRSTIFSYGFPVYGGDPAQREVLIIEGVGLEYYGIFHEPLSYLVDFCEDGMDACDLISSNAPVEGDKEIIVFPNPTQGALTVTISDLLLGATCTIFDCLGRKAQSFRLTELQTTTQLNSPGIYFWQAEHEGHLIKTGKLICN